MAKKVTIEMTEEQAKIVLVAVEEWFRLRMGQYSELANGLAFYGHKFTKDNPGDFDRRIMKRNHLNHIFRAIMAIVFPFDVPTLTEDETHIASDMWSQLRWELSDKKEWQSTPFQMGKEPMIKVTVKDKND